VEIDLFVITIVLTGIKAVDFEGAEVSHVADGVEAGVDQHVRL
jgi:hypothetical protein